MSYGTFLHGVSCYNCIGKEQLLHCTEILKYFASSPDSMFTLHINILSDVAFVALVALTAYYAIKRLHYHPLSKYPGPVLAALTSWYRAYYDIVKDGGWSEHLEYLHSKYGKIIRIGPNELHFSHPRAYNEIYGIGTRHIKQPEMYSCFSTDKSVFAMVDHHEVMQRRNLIGPFFSRRAILNLEKTVQEKIDLLVSRLLEYTPRKQSANLDLAFRATSLEVITSYCFARSSNALDSRNFQNEILSAIDQTLPMIWVFKHFPLVKRILLGVPECFASVLKPSTTGILEQRRQMGSQIDQILKDPTSLHSADHETIYHHFITPQPDNERMPPVHRDWLLDEGLYLRFAGSDTVGNTCTVAAYYILSSPHVHRKLFQSLLEAWPDKEMPASYETLERLPYLTAVIKESLRMAHGVVSPLPRIVGPADAVISGEVIPAGTVVSMAAPILHRNAEIFPNPLTFIPERWLKDESAELEKYLVAFSKGPRSCLGINLAWCELYLIIGTVFRKLDLTPDSPSIDNISFREYFVPIHRGRHFHAFVAPTKR
ncbi:Cytochrome P450 monooxygenase [Psilocybe cubensis]|uniref:Cytochrome P450 monooxygenase n=2 Tax=Psilocybe cubensis TaxID=181762 RepID=A0ACB8GUJ5_PSICU|nr:Cytochrome P450 monooxygenase [Psilocybe cubensis]KAH9479251.1 Cytochrome P450 monooxygenase [Psilocybe cubensis]